jgi:CDP-diglyceride synthetase
MDDPAGIIRFALAVAACYVWYFLERAKFDRESGSFMPAFWISLGLLAVYGASLFLLPNLAQALIGMAALGFAFAAAYPAADGGRKLAFAAILPLSLPSNPRFSLSRAIPCEN